MQIPYVLNQHYAEAVRYSEQGLPELADFAICLWEMEPLASKSRAIENIIVADGCIDLVVDYGGRQVGFAGMSKTDFHYQIDSASRYFGIRMKPGAFHQLTGLSAKAAMDTFLPINSIDARYPYGQLFAMPIQQAKSTVVGCLAKAFGSRQPDAFTMLFDQLSTEPPATTTELNRLSSEPPATATELYRLMHLGPRQCQRLFARHFGLTPQMVLCLVRFQRCLKMLTDGQASPRDVADMAAYYDQPHFINDFKKNLGITPFELVRRYQA